MMHSIIVIIFSAHKANYTEFMFCVYLYYNKDISLVVVSQQLLWNFVDY